MSARTVRTGRLGAPALAVAALLIATVAACTSARPEEPTWRGTAYPQQVAMPSMRLSDTDGRVFLGDQRCRDRVCVLIFGSTSQPAVIALARAALEATTGATPRLVVLVTNDATHDTMPRLRRTVAALDRAAPSPRATVTAVRGSFAATEAVARVLLVDLSPPPMPTTTPAVVGADPRARATVAWPLGVVAGDLRHDLAQLAAAA